jgi:hypothetical protein
MSSALPSIGLVATSSTTSDEEHNSYVALLHRIGNSPSSFAVCPSPLCILAGKVSRNHPCYDWAIELSCSCTVPATVCLVCTVCVNQRCQLKSLKQLKNHRTWHHQSSSSKKRKLLFPSVSSKKRTSS